MNSAYVNSLFDLFCIKRAKFQRSIKNSDITLRLHSLMELPVLHSLFNLDLLAGTSSPGHGGFGSLLLFYKWVISTFQMFYVIEILEKDGGRIVGFLGLYNVKIGKRLFLSIGIFNPEDRGKEYGKKSLEVLLTSLEKDCVVKSICVEILKTNVASLCFLMKNGFEVCEEYSDRFLLEKSLQHKW